MTGAINIDPEQKEDKEAQRRRQEGRYRGVMVAAIDRKSRAYEHNN
jgi:hypothetical protein